MSVTMKSSSTEGSRVSLAGSNSAPSAVSSRPASERDVREGKAVTSPLSMSSKEQQVLDDLAMLFTIQEERCFSRASRDNDPVSRVSLTSSQLSAEVAFIYQHIDFEVLSKCVPTFVKSNLNKSGRYLPETFILRVNYWRRRRALGDDSTAKRVAKENALRNSNANEQTTTSSNTAITTNNSNNRAPSASAKTPRPQSLSSKVTSIVS